MKDLVVRYNGYIVYRSEWSYLRKLWQRFIQFGRLAPYVIRDYIENGMWGIDFNKPPLKN